LNGFVSLRWQKGVQLSSSIQIQTIDYVSKLGGHPLTVTWNQMGAFLDCSDFMGPSEMGSIAHAGKF